MAARYYLDHNASMPPDARVVARFLEVVADSTLHANPSSLHQRGQRARRMLEDARAAVAAALGGPVQPDEIVFVSGGTEANNFAVSSLGDPALPVMLSAAEHASVDEPARCRGVVELPVDNTGQVRFDAVEDDVAVGLLCVVHGQNEVGTMQPLAAARALADRLAVPLHVDASQTLGRVALDEMVQVADSFTLSMHKAGGLCGSGILRVGRGLSRQPLLRGGQQERGLRAGTPAVALAVAAASTVQLAIEEQAERAAAMHRARAAFVEQLDTNAFTLLVPLARSLPNTITPCFDAVADGRMLLPALDLAGIDAAQGSACSSGSPSPPRILRAIGLDEARARRCVRFSFSHHTAVDEAVAAARIVRTTIERLRHVELDLHTSRDTAKKSDDQPRP